MGVPLGCFVGLRYKHRAVWLACRYAHKRWPVGLFLVPETWMHTCFVGVGDRSSGVSTGLLLMLMTASWLLS